MSRWFFMPVVACAAFLLQGCGPQFKVVQPDDASGRFPTNTVLGESDILLFEPIENLEHQSFNVLMNATNSRWAGAGYFQFVREMVELSGLQDLVDKRHVENLIIAGDLADQVPSFDNRIAFNRLAQYVGPYLIVSTELVNLGGDWWEFSVIVYDPVSSAPKFHAKRRGINWAGLDKPILLPVFNALKDWVDASKEASRPVSEAENLARRLRFSERNLAGAS